ncbi:hypothetical protein [Paenibacillus tarimensis]|uniref:hypothetical protein n=1 Tax=Paenibacillus tarimensis TaxID=416012 RepID=UPI001F402945|nr:hypothetical protein [Paenibacillus tarimensis]MCF2943744.1 hypothetical protein [Paenibacillus tarimensis]
MLKELQVAHCPSCGKVYQKNLRNLCRECSSRLDNQLSAIDRYLAGNRFADTASLSARTGVPVKTIHSFIRSRKLCIQHYPNLTTACESCSGPTREGKLCTSCTKRLTMDIHSMLEQEQALRQRSRDTSSFQIRHSSY